MAPLRRKQVPPAQIALAWLLALKLWSVPISGTSKLNQPEEKIGAAVQLTAADLQRIEQAVTQV